MKFIINIMISLWNHYHSTFIINTMISLEIHYILMFTHCHLISLPLDITILFDINFYLLSILLYDLALSIKWNWWTISWFRFDYHFRPIINIKVLFEIIINIMILFESHYNMKSLSISWYGIELTFDWNN